MLVAIVLPFCAVVHEGRMGVIKATRKPHEALEMHPAVGCPAKHLPFEVKVAAFVAAAFEDLPVEVAAWTRVPYLSSGTSKRRHFRLDNAVFVLRNLIDL